MSALSAGAYATLGSRYDALVCDLDGVVRRGGVAVPHAVPVLTQAVAAGTAVTYATNNASLTPHDVAAQLRGLGLSPSEDEVLTSSQAGAAHLKDLLGGGDRVLAVGGPGVADALRRVGLVPVTRYDDAVVAVLQGYGAGVTAADLAEASYAVENGAAWVATNSDATLPTERGIAPGNGSLVAAVMTASGATPVVTGKPHSPLYDLAVLRMGATRERTLGIGDRLDTDILGARRAGIDVLWVLSGVDDLRSLARDAARVVPTHVGDDLRALTRPPRRAEPADGWWRCGSVAVRVDDHNGDVDLDLPAAQANPADADEDTRADLLECAVRALVALRDGPQPPDRTDGAVVEQAGARLTALCEASGQ